jgi:hypothetical protein
LKDGAPGVATVKELAGFKSIQMLGEVEDDLKDAMGVDTTGIFGRTTLFGFALEQWKDRRGAISSIRSSGRSPSMRNG